MTTDDAALEAVESCRPTGPGQPLFTRREFAGACGSGLVGMAAAAGPAMAAERPADGALLAGAAEADITPFPGCQIDGNIGVPRPMETVTTPIHARALVLEQSGKRFCLLSMDLLAITTAEADNVRRMAADKFGFARDAVAVHVTQNHSAPSMGQIMLTDRLPATKKYPWLRGSHPDYAPLVLGRVEQAIAAAIAAVEPVTVAWAAAIDGRVSFNRRTIMRDGTAAMHLGGRSVEDVLQREGPSDPEVGVATFTADGSRTVAALLHHTCHPVHWTPHRAVHADWPGRWADIVRRDILPGATPLVVNGCCGNIHHHDLFNPSRDDTPESMGKLLAESTRTALSRPHAVESPALSWISETIRIPWRQFPADVFPAAHRLIDANPEPMWTSPAKDAVERDWCFAASLLDVEQMMRDADGFDYEVQAVRIGDLALVVLPGEPFVEAQLAIKAASPAKRTFFAHMANGYAGYIPTPLALAGGGYECRPSIASRLCTEALQMITDKSIAVLGKLYG
jgi:neutral ceramidase